MHYDLMRREHKSVSERVCASRRVKLSDRFHRNEVFWGQLNSVGPDLDGFVDVVLTGQSCLPVIAQVPLELASKLRPRVGQQVTIAHIKGHWTCGTERADDATSRNRFVELANPKRMMNVDGADRKPRKRRL